MFHCVYHKADADGCCSGAIVYQHFAVLASGLLGRGQAFQERS